TVSLPLISLYIPRSRHHRLLHSFPTRRSSDLPETRPAASPHPPAPRGSLRAPSLVAGVFFLLGALGGLRLDRGLRLGAGFGLGAGLGLDRRLRVFLLRLLACPLVIVDVEARALEHEPGAPRDLPLRHLAAGGALHPARVVHRRVELLERMSGRALVLVGRHRTTT